MYVPGLIGLDRVWIRFFIGWDQINFDFWVLESRCGYYADLKFLSDRVNPFFHPMQVSSTSWKYVFEHRNFFKLIETFYHYEATKLAQLTKIFLTNHTRLIENCWNFLKSMLIILFNVDLHNIHIKMFIDKFFILNVIIISIINSIIIIYT